MAPHYVYLIAGGSRFVKIGHSAKPAKRLIDLNVASPVTLVLEHTWELDGIAAAKRFEKKLHEAFAPYRANGEWFRLDVRWPRAVGDAALRFDGRAYRELLRCLANKTEAKAVAAELRYEGDHEEADVWESVGLGYETRAITFGLAENEWDVALRKWREAA